MKHEKKAVLITGGSRGIGRALVQGFERAGYLTAACATSRESAEQSGADLSFQCDVSDVQQVKTGLSLVQKRFGKIDVLINNAGASGTNSLDPETDDNLWHHIVGVNLNGPYFMSKYALPLMPDRTGKIINVASVLALKGVPDQTAYCAAKHGVLGLTRALSHAVAPRGITVNVVCPGWTRTDMAQGRMQELGLTEESLKTSVPIGRFIEPSEVAQLALYLASDLASGITGQSFTIDGGVLA